MTEEQKELLLKGLDSIVKAGNALVSNNHKECEKQLARGESCINQLNALKKKVLYLNISEPWYSMIASGEKTEEYREIKPHWIARLIANPSAFYLKIAEGKDIEVKPFTHAFIVNGYPKNNTPLIEKEIESITIGKPKPGLCPKEFENKDYFIIKFK